MAEAADCGHQPRRETPLQRRSPPGDDAVVMRGFGKSHRDAGAHRRREADSERRRCRLRREGRGEDRRQRRHRTVHQAREARLHPCQHELTPRLVVFLVARAARQRRDLKLFRLVLVLTLGGGEIAEQLARVGIGRGLRRADVEIRGVVLHPLGLRADALETRFSTSQIGRRE